MKSENMPYRLEMQHISKSFPNVNALDDVTINIRPGEVHALLGENGAGKSTLIKILSGAYQRDSGKILLDGKEIVINSPDQALNHGFVTIYQETNIASDLSVAENIYMGRLPKIAGIWLDDKKLHQDSQKVLNELNSTFSSTQLMKDLSHGQCQIVEIAKALTMDAKVIILDEPTAALTDREVNILFSTIRKLSAKGVSIILITHRLVEVFEICDRVTVLRDGRWVSTNSVSEINEEYLVTNMVGHNVTSLFPKSNAAIGDSILNVDKLMGDGFEDVSFIVRSGEIVGFFGLVGSGRTEVARSLFGADPIWKGEVKLDGKVLKPRSPKDAIRAGLSLVPEERKSEGLILDLSVRSNISLPSIWPLSKFGFIRFAEELLMAKKYKESTKNSDCQVACKESPDFYYG
jgi:ABC-type sugar transport system ATPase subunit